MAMPQEHEAVVQRATDAWNDRDREAFEVCYADQVIVRGPDGERRMNHDEHWEAVLGTFEVVPDLHATTEATIAEGDRVFVRWTSVGTPEGETRGVETDGRRAEWASWKDYRLDDGRIAEAWGLSDRLHRYESIGRIDVPERP